jgi:hypothetical protein
LKRLLALSLVAAAVAAPAATAKTNTARKTITVATATALAPGSDGVTITRSFRSYEGSGLPRAMYVVTSGPVGGVSTKVSCYPSVNSSWPKVNRGSAAGPGRVGLMYDQGSYWCTVTASAGEAYKKSGTIKIALQVVR